MRIAITGISGFVGHHFLQYLYDEGIEAEVFGLDIREPVYDTSIYADVLKIKIQIVDLLDHDRLCRILKDASPDYLLHLASYSSVAFSWKNPTESFRNNTNIFLNLITALQQGGLKCRVLSIGSSEEYGLVSKDELPIREDRKPEPISPYAVARVSQEMLSKVFVDSYGSDIILTRSFNHIGPWQDERFVVPSFARRILDIKRSGKDSGTIKTGDISIIRDFVDVRDVVRAYWLLLREGRVGEIYNICSGQGTSLSKVIDILADVMKIEVTAETDPDLIRPNDNPVIIGDPGKISSELGWKPSISLETTLGDIIKDLA